MEVMDVQQAFGDYDRTSQPMRSAIREWFDLYYGKAASGGDGCQRIAYTLVTKLTKAVFGEYKAVCEDAAAQQWLSALEAVRRQAMQLALVGGACYLKPWVKDGQFRFGIIPRDQLLIFARDSRGQLQDVGCMERSVRGKFYYTLLERRKVDDAGRLTVENTLYRSYGSQNLGNPVPLSQHPDYRLLPDRYTYPAQLGGVGLVELRTPMLNCVDGSREPVSVYAAAAALIRAIDENEAQLAGEFRRGQSRVFVSGDLLDEQQRLSGELFVTLDGDPQDVPVQVFAPELREKSYLARKQEYLRNVESVIGLKRGMLSDVSNLQRTATEVSDSQGEYSLTVMDFQQMWECAVKEALALCGALSGVYGLPRGDGAVRFDWGNGVLFDENALWQEYKEMVDKGLLAPEVALGWRFGLEAQTPEQRMYIRQRFMPDTQ